MDNSLVANIMTAIENTDKLIATVLEDLELTHLDETDVENELFDRDILSCECGIWLPREEMVDCGDAGIICVECLHEDTTQW